MDVPKIQVEVLGLLFEHALNIPRTMDDPCDFNAGFANPVKHNIILNGKNPQITSRKFGAGLPHPSVSGQLMKRIKKCRDLFVGGGRIVTGNVVANSSQISSCER